jgi:DNA invertase Pin-like site-specific DNA recombinase
MYELGVVTRLDRLGRSLRDLANVAHEIDEAGANFRVLEQAVDTSTSAGRAFFGMLAVFAAFETDVRRERQMEGIAMAKRRGVYTGRQPSLDRERVKQLAKDDLGPQRSRASWAWRAVTDAATLQHPAPLG